MAQQRSPWTPAGGGVVVRVLGNQCARDCGAGSRDGRTGRRANHSRRSTARCFSRCQPRRPTDCGKPPGGSLTGSTHTRRTLRHRIWRTRLLAGVAHRPVRTAVIAGSLEELTEGLREVAEGDFPYQAAVGQDDRGPVWVFSGQGSQWAAMGAELLATEPVFAATVAKVEPLIARESGFSVTEAISAPETVTGIDRIQPALFTMQVALAATMRSYGVRPGAVIGHSMGEVAAAVVAGALSLEDGVRVICRRSRLMSTIAGSGAMASVELPAAASAFGTDGSRRRRRRAGSGGLAAVHGDRRRHRRRCAIWSRHGSNGT